MKCQKETKTNLTRRDIHIMNEKREKGGNGCEARLRGMINESEVAEKG